MIPHSEFKRRKQQLEIPEKAAEIQKTSHKLYLCFTRYIIPFISTDILMEVKIIHARATLDQAIRLWYSDKNWHVPFLLLPL